MNFKKFLRHGSHHGLHESYRPRGINTYNTVNEEIEQSFRKMVEFIADYTYAEDDPNAQKGVSKIFKNLGDALSSINVDIQNTKMIPVKHEEIIRWRKVKLNNVIRNGRVTRIKQALQDFDTPALIVIGKWKTGKKYDRFGNLVDGDIVDDDNFKLDDNDIYIIFKPNRLIPGNAKYSERGDDLVRVIHVFKNVMANTNRNKGALVDRQAGYEVLDIRSPKINDLNIYAAWKLSSETNVSRNDRLDRYVNINPGADRTNTTSDKRSLRKAWRDDDAERNERRSRRMRRMRRRNVDTPAPTDQRDQRNERDEFDNSNYREYSLFDDNGDRIDESWRLSFNYDATPCLNLAGYNNGICPCCMNPDKFIDDGEYDDTADIDNGDNDFDGEVINEAAFKTLKDSVTELINSTSNDSTAVNDKVNIFASVMTSALIADGKARDNGSVVDNVPGFIKNSTDGVFNSRVGFYEMSPVHCFDIARLKYIYNNPGFIAYVMMEPNNFNRVKLFRYDFENDKYIITQYTADRKNPGKAKELGTNPVIKTRETGLSTMFKSNNPIKQSDVLVGALFLKGNDVNSDINNGLRALYGEVKPLSPNNTTVAQWALINEVLEKSKNNRNFEAARKEWTVNGYTTGKDDCICGYEEISLCYSIIHDDKKTVIEPIGARCVKLFNDPGKYASDAENGGDYGQKVRNMSVIDYPRYSK